MISTEPEEVEEMIVCHPCRIMEDDMSKFIVYKGEEFR